MTYRDRDELRQHRSKIGARIFRPVENGSDSPTDRLAAAITLLAAAIFEFNAMDMDRETDHGTQPLVNASRPGGVG